MRVHNYDQLKDELAPFIEDVSPLADHTDDCEFITMITLGGDLMPFPEEDSQLADHTGHCLSTIMINLRATEYHSPSRTQLADHTDDCESTTMINLRTDAYHSQRGTPKSLVPLVDASQQP